MDALNGSDANALPEVGENPHYLQAVTDMGERHEVVAQSDIYAANGVKLISKGTQITPEKFQQLIQHKLRLSFDRSIALGDPVQAEDLARQASLVLDTHAVIAKMTYRTGDPLAVKHELGRLALPFPMSQRLTVMRSERPQLFEHSVRTAMIAFALAQRMKLPSSELPLLLQAALCHDIGELHTDPQLLAPGHKIGLEERRFVHVHPVTGYSILSSSTDISPKVGKAVLQHHERGDGSGYPYGALADEITPLARIVGIAEASDAVIARLDPGRLDMMLRVGRIRFDPAILDVLRDLIDVPHTAPSAGSGEYDASRQLIRLANLLGYWAALAHRLHEHAASSSSSVSFLFARMRGIKNLILQAGFDPDDVQSIVAVAEGDPGILMELHCVLDEIDWLLQDLANEIDRRTLQFDGATLSTMDDLQKQLRTDA